MVRPAGCALVLVVLLLAIPLVQGAGWRPNSPTDHLPPELLAKGKRWHALPIAPLPPLTIPPYGSDPHEVDSFASTPDGKIVVYLRQDRYPVGHGGCGGWSVVGGYNWTSFAGGGGVKLERIPGSCLERIASLTWNPGRQIGGGPAYGFNAAVVRSREAPPPPGYLVADGPAPTGFHWEDTLPASPEHTPS